MLAWLIRITDGAALGVAVIGALALALAVLVTFADVTGRAFGAPLYGARDVVSMCGVIVVFGGLAWAHRNGAHIVVDLLERKFPPLLNRFLTVAGHWLGAVVMVLIAWQLLQAVGLARMLRMSTNLLFLPRAPFLQAMAAMAGVCALSMALRGLQAALAPERDARHDA